MTNFQGFAPPLTEDERAMLGLIPIEDLSETERYFFSIIDRNHHHGFITKWEWDFFTRNWNRRVSVAQAQILERIYEKCGVTHPIKIRQKNVSWFTPESPTTITKLK